MCFQKALEITTSDYKLLHRMILAQFRNEAIARDSDKNKFSKVESLSQQSLVTEVQNVKCASDRDCSMTELRLRQSELHP